MTTIPSAGTSRRTPVEFSEGSGRGGLVNGSGVIAALVRRGFTAMARIPVSIIPAIAMPVFFTVAFSGAFSALVLVPGFPTDNILNFMAPYACLQGAAFAGVAAAFSTGRDLETGFYDRLLMSPAPRWSLGAASVTYCTVRSLIPFSIVLLLATIGGLSFPAGPWAVVCLAGATLAVAALAALWAMGVTFRLRTQASAGLAQVVIFMAMFLSVGTSPTDIQQGWLRHVSPYNPLTPIMGLARAGFIGAGGVEWAEVWPGLVSIVGTGAILTLWCMRGFAKLRP